MAQTGLPIYGEVARVAFDLWRAIDGAPPENNRTPEGRQRALLIYAECIKAVEGEPFDITAIK